MHIAYPWMQNTEETIAKYAVDANLLRLGSTNPKKNIQTLGVFWWRAKSPTTEKIDFFSNVSLYKQFFFSKVFKFTREMQNVLKHMIISFWMNLDKYRLPNYTPDSSR